MRLKSRKKYTGCGGDGDGALTRVRSIQDTLTEIIPICNRIGVTRISNITFLDRLYIPNYSAILPGTGDIIWVYSGKGISPSIAKTGALMESIERYSSFSSTYQGKFIQGRYSQLVESCNSVLHPAEVVEPVNFETMHKDGVMDFLPGFDLFTNEKVLVPAEIALYRYSPKPPSSCAFSQFHTNGLASGNVLEEAICHALCEVIERDAVSIADLCSSSIPYNILEGIIVSLRKANNDRFPFAEDKYVDDSSLFPDVDISEIREDFGPLGSLVKKFDVARIPLLIKDITQKDIGIPTFVASSIEWVSHDYGYFAKGFGTHPDARIALIRAITETSQTRAVNIQGARDDLKKIRYKENDEIYKRKWQFMPVPSSSSERGEDNCKNIFKFSEIKTHMNEDILDDIYLILNGLKKAGLRRAIIVDLTNPEVGIPVVRAIVPGLETFEVTQSIMGGRAKKYFWSRYQS